MSEARVNLVQMAGMLARDPQFRAFAGYFMVPMRDDVSVDEAATFIRDACAVESRRDLATNTEAADRFHQFIRKPFLLWRERQQEHV